MIGIVIPARDEEKLIGACLESLQPFIEAGDHLIVVDACSKDATVTIVRKQKVPVISSPNPARGQAVALGVQYLLDHFPQCGCILIVHADMRFPQIARSVLINALSNQQIAGGCYGHRIQSSGWLYRIIEYGNNLRARYFHLSYGDQAQFFNPRRLQQAGGFPRQDRLEDLELAIRLKWLGKPVYLNTPVSIPTRHWENGVFFVTLRNWFTVYRYLRIRRKLTDQGG